MSYCRRVYKLHFKEVVFVGWNILIYKSIASPFGFVQTIVNSIVHQHKHRTLSCRRLWSIQLFFHRHWHSMICTYRFSHTKIIRWNVDIFPEYLSCRWNGQHRWEFSKVPGACRYFYEEIVSSTTFLVELSLILHKQIIIFCCFRFNMHVHVQSIFACCVLQPLEFLHNLTDTSPSAENSTQLRIYMWWSALWILKVFLFSQVWSQYTRLSKWSSLLLLLR